MLEGYVANTIDMYINENDDGIPHPLPKILNSPFERWTLTAQAHMSIFTLVKTKPLSSPVLQRQPCPAGSMNNTSPAANGCINIISSCTQAQMKMGPHLSPQCPHLLDTVHILRSLWKSW